MNEEARLKDWMLCAVFYSICSTYADILAHQRSSPDVKMELFELLYQILHNNWRFFFKSSVLASVQRGTAEEPMENEAQFVSAMQVTGVTGCGPW